MHSQNPAQFAFSMPAFVGQPSRSDMYSHEYGQQQPGYSFRPFASTPASSNGPHEFPPFNQPIASSSKARMMDIDAKSPQPSTSMLSGTQQTNFTSPIYGQYGTSFIEVNQDPTPFARIASSFQNLRTLKDVSVDGRSRSPPRSPGRSSTASSDEFDPIAPHLPKAIGGNFPGLYSSTGFDLVGVLARVVARPQPTISLGPVDASVAFIVVDARKFDYPIVYASETFSRLTGYHNMEIVGKNCRFLQSPSGQVLAGAKRTHTDGKGVFHMKSHIVAAKETQISLINYRKDGTPFINLVTIIPIAWDTEDIAYFVGFQVDLVDQPNAILERMQNGSYIVNYSLLPKSAHRKVVEGPASMNAIPSPIGPHSAAILPASSSSSSSNSAMMTNTPHHSHVPRMPSTSLAKSPDHGTTDSPWDAILLKNCNDLIFVLSLKGVFLYVSPISQKILEYENTELLNCNISDFCHPSDLIAVMRELKDSGATISPAHQIDHRVVYTSGASISMLFRIKRKRSGYIWMEASGRIYAEAGKVRKYVVMAGRERPVYNIAWAAINVNAGGLGESEFWWKSSAEGICLYTTPDVKQMLGYEAEELIGIAIVQLAAALPGDPHRPSQVAEIQACLRQAASGQAASLRHFYRHKNGKAVECYTNFFPNTASSTSTLPAHTFILCQTNEYESELRRQNRNEYAFQTLESQHADRTSNGELPETRDESFSSSSFKSANVFTELETSQSTSWQYELQQLKIANRRLKDEITRMEKKKRDMQLAEADTTAILPPTFARSSPSSDFPSLSSPADDSSPAPTMSRSSSETKCNSCGTAVAQRDLIDSDGRSTLCMSCAIRWQRPALFSRDSMQLDPSNIQTSSGLLTPMDDLA